MRKVWALVGLGCTLACLSACGVTVGPRHTLNAASVAHEISSQLAGTYQVEAPAVTCPADIQASKGTTFVCTTVLDGQPLDLDGTVTRSNGQYQVIPRDAIIPIPSLVKYLTESITQKTGDRPTVNCGPRQVAIVAVGGTITCSAAFARLPETRRVTTTVVDKEGHVKYTLAQ